MKFFLLLFLICETISFVSHKFLFQSSTVAMFYTFTMSTVALIVWRPELTDK